MFLKKWRNRLRSLYADPGQYWSLPEEERCSLWAVQTADIDREFAHRTEGKTLVDIGCGPPPTRNAVKGIPYSRYIGIDFLPECLPDLVASVDRLPLRNETVDSINCLSVLEHVYEPRIVIREMFRVLRPGGCARIQVPFLLGYHGYPDDFYRYTHTALRRMFEDEGFHVCLLDTDWSKGAILNAAKTLEDGSWSFSRRRWRLLTRLLSKALLGLRFIDNYSFPGQVGIYHALALLAEKPVSNVAGQVPASAGNKLND